MVSPMRPGGGVGVTQSRSQTAQRTGRQWGWGDGSGSKALGSGTCFEEETKTTTGNTAHKREMSGRRLGDKACRRRGWKIYYDIDWRFNVWPRVLVGVQTSFVIPHLPAGELIGF